LKEKELVEEFAKLKRLELDEADEIEFETKEVGRKSNAFEGLCYAQGSALRF
jgi:hypothetical protein